MKKVIVLLMLISTFACFSMKRNFSQMTNAEIQKFLAAKCAESKKRAIANAQTLRLAGVRFFYPNTEILADQLEYAQTHIKNVLDAVNAEKGTALHMYSIIPYVDENGESSGPLLRFIQSAVECSYLPESSSKEERAKAIEQTLQELEDDKEERGYIYPGKRTKRQWQKDMKEIFSKVPHYRGLHVCSED